MLDCHMMSDVIDPDIMNLCITLDQFVRVPLISVNLTTVISTIREFGTKPVWNDNRSSSANTSSTEDDISSTPVQASKNFRTSGIMSIVFPSLIGEDVTNLTVSMSLTEKLNDLSCPFTSSSVNIFGYHVGDGGRLLSIIIAANLSPLLFQTKKAVLLLGDGTGATSGSLATAFPNLSIYITTLPSAEKLTETLIPMEVALLPTTISRRIHLDLIQCCTEDIHSPYYSSSISGYLNDASVVVDWIISSIEFGPEHAESHGLILNAILDLIMKLNPIGQRNLIVKISFSDIISRLDLLQRLAGCYLKMGFRNTPLVHFDGTWTYLICIGIQINAVSFLSTPIITKISRKTVISVTQLIRKHNKALEYSSALRAPQSSSQKHKVLQHVSSVAQVGIPCWQRAANVLQVYTGIVLPPLGPDYWRDLINVVRTQIELYRGQLMGYEGPYNRLQFFETRLIYCIAVQLAMFDVNRAYLTLDLVRIMKEDILERLYAHRIADIDHRIVTLMMVTGHQLLTMHHLVDQQAPLSISYG